MIKSLILFKVRIRSLKNILIVGLFKYPMLIGLFVVAFVPIFIGLETGVSDFGLDYTLNPNISEFMNSLSSAIFLLLKHAIPLFAMLYFFISQISIKSHSRYRSYNITFKNIYISNIFTALVLLGIVMIFVFTYFILRTGSSIVAGLFQGLILLLVFNIIFIAFSLTYQVLSNLVIRLIPKTNAYILEIAVVVLLTLIPQYIVMSQTLGRMLAFKWYYFLIILLLVLVCSVTLFIKIETSYKYVVRSTARKKDFVLGNSNMTYVKNYFLMLSQIVIVYIDYIIMIVILYLFSILMGEFSAYKSMFYQIIPFIFLVANGNIMNYYDWYKVRDKHSLKKMLVIDYTYSLFFLWGGFFRIIPCYLRKLFCNRSIIRIDYI